MTTIQDIAENSDAGSSPDIGEITANWSADEDEEAEGSEDNEWENSYWHPRRELHQYAQRNLSLTHRSAYPLQLRHFLIRQNVRAALGLPLSADWKDTSSDPEIVNLAIQNASEDEYSIPGPINLAYHEFALLEDHSPESEKKWLEKDNILVDYRTWERIATYREDIFPLLTYEEAKEGIKKNGRASYLQDEMGGNETASINVRYLATFIQLLPDGKSLDYDYSWLREMDIDELFMATLLIAHYGDDWESNQGPDSRPRWGVAELLHRERWIYKGFRDRYLTEVGDMDEKERNETPSYFIDEQNWAGACGWNEIWKTAELDDAGAVATIYPGDKGEYSREEIEVIGENGPEKKTILRRKVVSE